MATPNKRRGGFLGGVIFSSFFMVFLLAIFFYITTDDSVPARVKDSIQFLQDAIFFGSLLLILTIPFDISVVRGFVGEYTSVLDVGKGVVVGIVVGLLFLVFALGGPADALTHLISLGQYHFEPTSLSGSGWAGELKTVSTTQSVPISIFQSALINTLIGASEEFTMGVLFSLSLVGFGIAQQKDSFREIEDPNIIYALFLRAAIFGVGYHIFAYTNRLEFFNAGFFISAGMIGVVFGLLYLWNGILPCIIAHAVYDFGLDVVSSTGWSFLIKDIFILVVFCIGVFYGGEYIYRKTIGNQ